MKNSTSELAASVLAEKEKELVFVMQTGSENAAQRAFNQLYANRKQGVFNKLKVSLKGNEEDAEDLMQEAFTRVWLHIKSYNGSTNFSTWLYAITKNVLIDHIRKQKHEIIRMDSMSPTMNDGSDSFKDRSFQITDSYQKDAIGIMTAAHNKTLVHKAINNIKKDEMRKIIYMKYIEQKSGREICAELNMPIGTYKANNFRAEQLVKAFIVKAGLDTTPFKGQKNPKKDVQETED